jgi:hypothetical protein
MRQVYRLHAQCIVRRKLSAFAWLREAVTPLRQKPATKLCNGPLGNLWTWCGIGSRLRAGQLDAIGFCSAEEPCAIHQSACAAIVLSGESQSLPNNCGSSFEHESELNDLIANVVATNPIRMLFESVDPSQRSE